MTGRFLFSRAYFATFSSALACRLSAIIKQMTSPTTKISIDDKTAPAQELEIKTPETEEHQTETHQPEAPQLQPETEAIPEQPPRPNLELVDTRDEPSVAKRELVEFTKDTRELGAIASHLDIDKLSKALEISDMQDQAQILVRNKLFKEKIDDSNYLAQEIIELYHSPLFQNLEQKAQTAFPKNKDENDNEYKERINHIASETKKPFFELMSNGILSASDINRLVSGGIRFVDKPPERISHAVASVGSRDNKPRLTFYENYFDDSNVGREHIVKHEIGHIISANIFGSDISKLQEMVRDPAQKSDDLPPHLRMVVEMIRHPEEAAKREHRGEGSHLHRELMKLKDDDDTQRRADLVDEIFAERIANFFESDGTLESYAALRFGNVDPALMKDGDLHFASEKMMFDAIKQGMESKNSWVVDNRTTEILLEDYEYEFPDEYDDLNGVMARPPSPVGFDAKAGGAPGPKSTLEKFFAWLVKSNEK